MSSPKVKTSTTNKSNTKEQEREWTVQLYRFTEGNNKWQKGVAATMVKAVPQKDCIVIPALRQKFSVLSAQGKHCVIQRDSCILLVSQKRTRGGLVLQFKNREDCLAFSDQFLELNQHPTPTNHSKVQGTSLPAAKTTTSYHLRATMETLLMDPATHSALSILYKQNLLHWSDALFLGVTCKDMRKVWKEEHCDAYLSPLLQVLEGFIGPVAEDYEGSNKYQDLLKDLPEDYSKFSVIQQCAEMTFLLEKFVRNMQMNDGICLDDPVNLSKNRSASAWIHPQMIYHPPDDIGIFLEAFPHRICLGFSIEIFRWAQGAMLEGGNSDFNDVFRGIESAVPGDGSIFYGRGVWENVIIDMFPFKDEDLIKGWKSIYPNSGELALLGPTLTDKVIFTAPFFRFLPPNGSKIKGLPTPLEPMDLLESYLKWIHW